MAGEPYRFFLKFRRALAAPFTIWGSSRSPAPPSPLWVQILFTKPKRRTDPSGRRAVLAEGVGFEPTRASRPSGFQDRPDSQIPCTPPRQLYAKTPERPETAFTVPPSAARCNPRVV